MEYNLSTTLGVSMLLGAAMLVGCHRSEARLEPVALANWEPVATLNVNAANAANNETIVEPVVITSADASNDLLTNRSNIASNDVLNNTLAVDALDKTQQGDVAVEPQVVDSHASNAGAWSATDGPVTVDALGQRVYVVAKGDSLWQIAKKYCGSGQRWVEIAQLNHLDKPTKLGVGQKLILP